MKLSPAQLMHIIGKKYIDIIGENETWLFYMSQNTLMASSYDIAIELKPIEAELTEDGVLIIRGDETTVRMLVDEDKTIIYARTKSSKNTTGEARIIIPVPIFDEAEIKGKIESIKEMLKVV